MKAAISNLPSDAAYVPQEMVHHTIGISARLRGRGAAPVAATPSLRLFTFGNLRYQQVPIDRNAGEAPMPKAATYRWCGRLCATAFRLRE
jgi:hypothetical protein